MRHAHGSVCTLNRTTEILLRAWPSQRLRKETCQAHYFKIGSIFLFLLPSCSGDCSLSLSLSVAGHEELLQKQVDDLSESDACCGVNSQARSSCADETRVSHGTSLKRS